MGPKAIFQVREHDLSVIVVWRALEHHISFSPSPLRSPEEEMGSQIIITRSYAVFFRMYHLYRQRFLHFPKHKLFWWISKAMQET